MAITSLPSFCHTRKMNCNFHSILAYSLLCICLSSTLQAQEVEDGSLFDYIQGSEKGPEKWGGLNKEWAACKNGDMQSPIDLSSHRVTTIPEMGKLHKKYQASNAKIKNRGHDISIKWLGDAGWIRINGSVYNLTQAHWHSPSEHTINGHRYALELHMVHQTNDPKAVHKLAVVGMFYNLGRPDPFLTELLKNITLTMEDHLNEEEVRGFKVVDPNEIKVAGQTYYRYIGSLTVPPCTEGVIWTIKKRVRTVSTAQLAALREAVHDHSENNARPVQALNNRGIYYYNPVIPSY